MNYLRHSLNQKILGMSSSPALLTYTGHFTKLCAMIGGRIDDEVHLALATLAVITIAAQELF